eukprot:Colp12_sorted_trinity150504_noHs@27068
MYAGQNNFSNLTWFIKDPCGIFAFTFCYLLILYAEFVVCVFVLLPWYKYSAAGYFLSAVFTALCGLAACSHHRCMRSDPGAVPLPDVESPYTPPADLHQPVLYNGEYVTYCKKCNNYKPYLAHHCSICKRCIRKLDHHCPWVNNCVGEYNQKYFLQFLVYIFLCSAFTLYVTISRLAQCFSSGFHECEAHADSRLLFLVFVILEGLVFGLFTIAMFLDQIYSISQGTTGIDRLKQNKVTKRPCMTNMREVFGGPFSYTWLLPLPSRRLHHGSYMLV